MRILELFAGVGSQTQALKNLKIDHISDICEFDKYAYKSYQALHGPVFNYGDIMRMQVPNVYYDMWTYSYPCQDLSIAGKGAGIKVGTRSGLLFEVERLLVGTREEMRPKILLMENVKPLIGKKHKPNFNIWLKKLEDLGYKTTWKMLNAKYYGVAQNRERVFAISSLDHNLIDNYKWPEERELKYKLKDYLQKENLEYKHNKDCYYLRHYKKKGKSEFNKKYTLNQKISNTISVVMINQRASGNPFFLDVEEQEISKETYEKKYNHLCVRKLTPRECWRLMGYSDLQFDKVENKVSNAQLYKQAGNGIVVPILEQIFANLFGVKYVDNHEWRIDKKK